MEQSPYAIDMQNIVKKFGSVIANDHVNFRVKKVKFMHYLVKMVLAKVRL